MDRESKVTSMIEAIRARDTKLGDELQARREQREAADEARRFKPILESAVEGREQVRPQLALETIVLRTGRPVLAVSHDEPQLTFSDAESEVWRARLAGARAALLPAIRAVGRIELENNPRFDWVGTGWLVRPDVIVTNRHVALSSAEDLGRISSSAPAQAAGPWALPSIFWRNSGTPGPAPTSSRRFWISKTTTDLTSPFYKWKARASRRKLSLPPPPRR